MCHLIAVIGNTAAEIIYNRADSKKSDAPTEKLLKVMS